MSQIVQFVHTQMTSRFGLPRHLFDIIVECEISSKYFTRLQRIPWILFNFFLCLWLSAILT